MLRPGRLGKLLYVPLPCPSDRISILKALTRKVAINTSTSHAQQKIINFIQNNNNNNNNNNNTQDSMVIETLNQDDSGTNNDTVNIEDIATDTRTDGFSGADLSALVREAGLAVIKEWRTNTNINSSITTATANSTNTNKTNNNQNHLICKRHFEVALSTVRSSVSEEEKLKYDKVNELLKSGVSAVQALKIAKRAYPS